MAAFDVSSYHDLFITNAKECLNDALLHINALSEPNPIDIPTHVSEIHRRFHMLKSQCHFMGYPKTGALAAEIEKLSEIVKNNAQLYSTTWLQTVSKASLLVQQAIAKIEKDHTDSDFSKEIQDLELVIAQTYENPHR